MTAVDPRNDRLIVFDASANDLGSIAIGELIKSGVSSASGVVSIALGADGRVSFSVDPSTFTPDIMTLPTATPAAADYIPIYDNSAGVKVKATLGNIMTQLGPFIRETGGNLTGAVTMTTGTQAMIGADGGYTPATLPAASLFAAVQYCTGMGGAGGASGAVYSDGTNWRKISNDMIVI